MPEVIFWTLIFSISGTATTVLLGDRNILSGNLLSLNKFIFVIFHWKFILAIICSFFARYSFMLINNNLLKIPSLAQNSTTITALISSLGIIFMIIANHIFLGERINLQQGLGATLILIGIWIILK